MSGVNKDLLTFIKGQRRTDGGLLSDSRRYSVPLRARSRPVIADPTLPLLGFVGGRHVTIADAEETGKPLTEEGILP